MYFSYFYFFAVRAAKISMGMETSETDMENIVVFTERMISLAIYKKELYAYLEEKMATVAPNLRSVSHAFI